MLIGLLALGFAVAVPLAGGENTPLVTDLLIFVLLPTGAVLIDVLLVVARDLGQCLSDARTQRTVALIKNQ